MERLLVLLGGETVTPADLPEKILKNRHPEPPSPAQQTSAASFPAAEPLPPPPAIMPVPAEGIAEASEALRLTRAIDPGGDFNLTSFMGDVERTLVLKALEKAGGNRSRAAEILGINRTTLIEKLKRFGIS